ncbi:MAG: Rpn family recombination-promoting nuclease/putative transposase [Myxococcota bacterium]
MPSSAHDKLVKFAFGEATRAEALLRFEIPQELAEQVAWSTLRVEPTDFLHASLEALHVDLLFSAQLEDGGLIDFLILLEHQSTVDPRMAFRILRYVVRIWTKRSRGPRLPFVVPIVLYNGPRPWNAPTDVRDLVSVPALGELEALVPRLRFILDDLTQTTPEEVRARPLDVFGVLALLALMLRGPEPGRDLETWLPLLQQLDTNEEGIRALGALFEYLTRTVDHLRTEDLHSLARQLPPAAEEAIMTAAEQLRAEGREEGLEQGRREGIQRGLEEGRHSTLQSTLLKLLHLRFGEVSPWVRARVFAANSHELEGWTTRILTVEDVDALFD